MARCAGTKPDGSPCSVLVSSAGSLCYWHDPRQAAARKRNAARGGRSRTGEAKEIRVLLRQFAADVVSGDLEREKATAAGQLLNYALRALLVERQLLETEELEQRIAEMERGA